MTEEPKMTAGPVTVDQMVRDPALPSRRRKLADWWGGWLCHWRERAALRLAPWLDNYGEGL